MKSSRREAARGCQSWTIRLYAPSWKGVSQERRCEEILPRTTGTVSYDLLERHNVLYVS